MAATSTRRYPQRLASRDVTPETVEPMLDRVVPVHSVVRVDFHMPGCPPPAPRIRAVLEQLLDGERPHLEGREIKFG